MVGNQTYIFVLPFVAVGLDAAVFQMRLKMGGLMQKDPQEHKLRQVTIDRHFVERVPRLRPAVVAQLAAALTSDMEMHLVALQILIHPPYRLLRQVVA